MERNIKIGKQSGFTILELMIVMTIIGILVGIAIPAYQWSLLRAKETVLLDNQRAINEVIDQYTADNKKAPQTLQDLVDKGYFREIPIDPMQPPEQQRTSWVTKQNTGVSFTDQTDTGIGSVCSGSTQVSSDGQTTYNSWPPGSTICP